MNNKTLSVTANTPTNEIQTITLTSWDPGDTVKLTFNGHESSAVTNTGTQTQQSAAFEAALVGLSDFVVGDVAVTNGTTTSKFVVTFGGAFASIDVSAITVTSGTGSAAGTVAETRKGLTTFHGTNTIGRFMEVVRVDLDISDVVAGSPTYSLTGDDGTTLITSGSAADYATDGYVHYPKTAAGAATGLVRSPAVRLLTGSLSVASLGDVIHFTIFSNS